MKLLGGNSSRIERLCNSNRITIARGTEGIERLEAHLHGQAFAPHRHDTYAIGITLSGVQTFRFRSERWHCLPGQCHILHPDETHDGAAETHAGFSYRIVYVDPALIQQSLSGRPLPFVAQPVLEAARLREAHEIWDFSTDFDDMRWIELVSLISNLLLCSASHGRRISGSLALRPLLRVRDCIADSPAERQSLDQLERIAGLDRWTLARQFRAAFGTSPSRFRTMRQLDHVRRLLELGAPLAEAAIDAGFADQAHMSRHFKRAYGLTPGDWVSTALARA